VLTDYDLNESEISALKAIDAENMESLAGGLDERESSAGCHQ
jgi:formylmethanofuran dehydrogenase subunit A